MHSVRRLPAALIAVALAFGAVPAEAVSVYLPPAEGFHIGHQARSGRQILVELVPAGETVQHYSRMISLQTFPGMAGAPPPTFLAEFAKRYVARCPGTTATAVPLGSGIAGVRLDCTRHPATGKPETVFARALPVGPDMALVHVTLASFAMPPAAQWARTYLGKVRLQ